MNAMPHAMNTFTPQRETLFAYGFRPFFLLAAGYGITSIAVWTLAMTGWVALPIVGDVIAWHIHELVFGFAGAALGGFLMTAVPEWTSTEPVNGRALQSLVVVWLLARITAWTTSVMGVVPMAVLNLFYLVWLVTIVARPLWKGAQGRHRVFLPLVLCLIGLQTALYLAWAAADYTLVRSLLNSTIGLFLSLILAALGRISMVIVNEALDKNGVHDKPFLARPPRRNFAMGVLAIFLIVDHLLPFSTTAGWVALATAASLLNVLNDWHLRGVWRDLYVQALYLVYLFMAFGFALIGVSYLWEMFPSNYARHAFAIGAMGLSVLAVLTIAGQRHTGRNLAYHWRIRAAFLCVVSAVIARVIPPWLGPEAIQSVGYALSALFWCLGFTLYLTHFWGFLTSPRADGLPG